MSTTKNPAHRAWFSFFCLIFSRGSALAEARISSTNLEAYKTEVAVSHFNPYSLIHPKKKTKQKKTKKTPQTDRRTKQMTVIHVPCHMYLRFKCCTVQRKTVPFSQVIWNDRQQPSHHNYLVVPSGHGAAQGTFLLGYFPSRERVQSSAASVSLKHSDDINPLLLKMSNVRKQAAAIKLLLQKKKKKKIKCCTLP